MWKISHIMGDHGLLTKKQSIEFTGLKMNCMVK